MKRIDRGGTYRLTLTFDPATHTAAGKTAEHEDVVEATFVELVPDERVVWRIVFDSDDPAFAGATTMTWRLLPATGGGTAVTVVCEDVPEGTSKEDHEVGLQSTLDNLATFIERSQ